jgi:hypothetical protein
LRNGSELLQKVGQVASLLQNRPGFVGVIPEPVLGDDGFDCLESVLFARQVKDSLSTGSVFRSNFGSFA